MFSPLVPRKIARVALASAASGAALFLLSTGVPAGAVTLGHTSASVTVDASSQMGFHSRGI